MKIKCLHILWVFLILSNSCAIDDEEYTAPQRDCPDKKKGRFDNVPFQWDYIYTASEGDSLRLIFENYHADTCSGDGETRRIGRNARSDGGRTYGGRNGRREKDGRESYGGRREAEDGGRRLDDLYRKEDLFISNPVPVYLGAVFPEAEFGTSFKRELLFPKNPYNAVFQFNLPFVRKVSDEDGMIYENVLHEALTSQEYDGYMKSKSQDYFEFKCAEYYSFSDIVKMFNGNLGLAGIFSSKISLSRHTTNIKSRLLGLLVSSYFTVSMKIPPTGIFKDRSKDSIPENPVYVYSITYGKIAFLSVESEYSFSEVKKAIQAAINYKILSIGGDFTEKEKDIISKSSISLFVISEGSPDNHFLNSLENIKNSFDLHFSKENRGYPIFCQGNYTKDNSAFKLPEPERKEGREYKPGEGIGGGRGNGN